MTTDEEKTKGKKKVLQLDPETAAVFRKKGYEVKHFLSNGAFGEVYEGEVKESKQRVAIKCMNLDKAGKTIEETYFPREKEALIKVEHEHVIQVLDIWRANRVIYIIMEFAEDGDIRGYLKARGPCPESLAAWWFEQVSSALQYMHDTVHMAHRDIKVDNILLTQRYKISKLTDFGFATTCRNEETEQVKMSRSFCGTKPYQSYQLIKKVPYSPMAADCHAMGVTLFVMLNGHNRFPFRFDAADGTNALMLSQMVKRAHRTRYIKPAGAPFSHQVLDLVDRLMEIAERDRLTMTAVLEHEWIKRRGRCPPGIGPFNYGLSTGGRKTRKTDAAAGKSPTGGGFQST